MQLILGISLGTVIRGVLAIAKKDAGQNFRFSAYFFYVFLSEPYAAAERLHEESTLLPLH
ncbi:MAG: hypothetical protein AAF685_03780 [Cyanobacteria bacterium P01_C01_bin.89]